VEEKEMSSQLDKYKAGSKKIVKVGKNKKPVVRQDGRKWDGTSRPSTDEYRRNWNEIFKNNMGND